MKKSLILIFIITILIGFIFLTTGEKKQSKEINTKIKINENDDSLSIEEDNNKFSGDDNKDYEIPSLNELSKTEKFFNLGYIISMKSYLRVNQILNMDIDEINETKRELKEFEEVFNALEVTEETRLAKQY